MQLLPQTQVIYSIFLGLVFKLSVAGDDPVLDNGDNGDCLLDLEELGLEARLFLAEEGNERGILGKKNKKKRKKIEGGVDSKNGRSLVFLVVRRKKSS